MQIIKLKCDCKIQCEDTLTLEKYEKDSFLFEYKDGDSGLTRRIFFDRDILEQFNEGITNYLQMEPAQ